MMKYVLRRVGAVLVSSSALVCLLLLSGCASSGSAPGAGGALPSREGVDLLRIGELVAIEFSGVTDPPPRHEERIKTDGMITLPSVGAVQAAGKTRGQLEEDIHNLYVPRYYKQLAVVVRNEGRFFYVNGQVRSPNQYPYLKEMTVLKAIATAGGFTDFSKKSKVLVTRADGRKITVNCDKALRNPKLDIPIYPDDTIEVPRRYW